MKYLYLVIITTIFLAFPGTLLGRTSSHEYLINDLDLDSRNIIEQFDDYDFSPLFSGEHSKFNIGYIGANYRRIRIKLISVLQNPFIRNEYLIFGKSNVSDNICEFQGTIKIAEIRQYEPMHYGVDQVYIDKGIQFQGLLIADYLFYENQRQSYSGYFSGKLYIGWYLDKDNKIRYDDIELDSDRWCNSQFVGHWTSYSTKKQKVCNWGFVRIPQSGDLDIGTAEFYPNEKYLDQGWEVYYKAWCLYPHTDESMKAIDTEKLEWWK